MRGHLSLPAKACSSQGENKCVFLDSARRSFSSFPGGSGCLKAGTVDVKFADVTPGSWASPSLEPSFLSCCGHTNGQAPELGAGSEFGCQFSPSRCSFGLKTVTGATWPQRMSGGVSNLIMQSAGSRAWHTVGAQKMAFSSSSSQILAGFLWQQVFENHEGYDHLLPHHLWGLEGLQGQGPQESCTCASTPTPCPM